MNKNRGPTYTNLVDFPGGPLPAFTVKKKEEVQQTTSTYVVRTPGETDVLKAVERNLSKQAFKTLIRFIYLSPQTIFYDSFARRGLTGAFNQYAALDLNSFIQNFKMSTRTLIWAWPHIFPSRRNEYKKQRLLWLYRHRAVPPETFMSKLLSSYLFNWNFTSRRFLITTESLATLFHPPTAVVMTVPHMQRIESRKAGPPSGLPIFGEEEEMQKFKA